MARGSGEYSLLLSPKPPGLRAAAEVVKRVTLWEQCRFEEHVLPSCRPDATRQPGQRLLDRARRTAVGAHLKATTILLVACHSSSMIFIGSR